MNVVGYFERRCIAWICIYTVNVKSICLIRSELVFVVM
jgi:hypothetical protein